MTTRRSTYFARLRALVDRSARAVRGGRDRTRATGVDATAARDRASQAALVGAIWVTPVDDPRDHLVSMTTFARSGEPAWISTWCGRMLLPAALTCAPKPHCPECSEPAALRAPTRFGGRPLACPGLGPLHAQITDQENRMSQNPATAAFSRSDHLPLGARFGGLTTWPERASAARPFGLLLAEPPREITDVDTDAFRYDHDRQIGTMYDAETRTAVPLARHTDGQTGTVTNTDGHQGRDSDTDHRED